MTAEELVRRSNEFNPVRKMQRLAEARLPIFIIHGDQDDVVPLRENSQTVADIYREANAGDAIHLLVVEGQGHNYWEGFFRCQALVDFVIERAKAGVEGKSRARGWALSRSKPTATDVYFPAHARESREHSVRVTRAGRPASGRSCRGEEPGTQQFDTRQHITSFLWSVKRGNLGNLPLRRTRVFLPLASRPSEVKLHNWPISFLHVFCRVKCPQD